jgi:hypothetical protein
VADGTKYEEPGTEQDNYTGWKYTMYDGPFLQDKPHGKGVQRFKDTGTYVGEFRHGLRHGRGTWTTNAGWRYSALPDDRTPNWENDEMHGLCFIEDDSHVHENVIYTHGKCQMPFVDKGPPATGFDNTMVIGGVVKTLNPGTILSTKTEMELPGFSMADEGAERSAGRKDTKKATWSAKDKDLMPTAIVAYRTKINDPDHVDPMTASAQTTLVREPTDLNMPDEDVYISGGTGENEILNGLYFKTVGSFGLRIFRHVKTKKSTGLLGGKELVQRFLWQDPKKGLWLATEAYNAVQFKAGVCFVDELTDHPAAVKSSWYVWHAYSQTMKFPEEDFIEVNYSDGWEAELSRRAVETGSKRCLIGIWGK